MLLPIIISTLFGLLFLAIISLVIFLVIQKKNHDTNTTTSAKPIRFQEIVSNFFSLSLLITNVVSITTILFILINELFTDELLNGSYYNYNNDKQELHSAVSLIVITIPAALILTYWMRKQEKGEAIEKFTVNLTLIATTITIAGSIFSVIYSFLEGSLDTQFFLKVVSIIIIAASIFVYYKIIYKSKEEMFKIASIVLASIVAISIGVLAVVKTGTPGEIRKEKFDDRRLQDLSSIQGTVLNYWQRNRILPESLVAMSDPMYQTAIPVDPKTNKPYRYEIIEQSKTANGITTAASFKICATFETKREKSKDFEMRQDYAKSSIIAGDFESYYPGNNSPFWDHEKGEKCFVRDLNPKIHLPEPIIPSQPIPIQ